MRRTQLPPARSPFGVCTSIPTGSLLDEMDPLRSTKPASTTKTPQSFLGENSCLVNLDQLIKTSTTSNNGQAYNPFGDLPQQQKPNLFQQQSQPVFIGQPPMGQHPHHSLDLLHSPGARATNPLTPPICCHSQVPSINQLKSQSPFSVSLSQDPWAPINANNSNQVIIEPNMTG